MIFELAGRRKFSGEQLRQYSEYLCIRSFHQKFDVLKPSLFALKALLLRQIFVSRTSNFFGATISP